MRLFSLFPNQRVKVRERERERERRQSRGNWDRDREECECASGVGLNRVWVRYPFEGERAVRTIRKRALLTPS